MKSDVNILNSFKNEKDMVAVLVSLIASKWWTEAVMNPFKFLKEGESKLKVSPYPDTVKKIDSDKIKIFHDSLCERVYNRMKNSKELILRVDYNPTGELYNAAYDADIDEPNFPCNTKMIIRKDLITLYYLDSSEEIILYAVEEYLRGSIRNLLDESQIEIIYPKYEYIEEDSEKRDRVEFERKKLHSEITRLSNYLPKLENGIYLHECVKSYNT